MLSPTRSKIDVALGMHYYTTSSQRFFNAKIRVKIEDFIVEEILRGKFIVPASFNARKIIIPLSSSEGNYVRAVMVKRGYDTISAILKLAQNLKLPIDAFSYLGLKDARAVSAQLISIKTQKDIPMLQWPRLSLTYYSRSKVPLKLHELYGNRFTITIRDIDMPINVALKRMEEVIMEIKETGGVLAYFGYQRFGTTRPITHIVGRYIVKRDFESAIKCLLNLAENEHKIENKKVISGYERILAKHFKGGVESAIKSLRKIFLPIRRLFVHAYQSYLFNKILSKRIEMNIPLNRAVIGDLVGLPAYGSVPPEYVFKVDRTNIDRVNRLIKQRILSIVLPVPGYKIKKLPCGLAREPIDAVMDDENVSFNDFLIEQLPSLSSPGMYRPALFEIEDLRIKEVVLDNVQKPAITIQFILRRGFYATVVLREFIKPIDVVNSGF